jgi:hypothetical protein
MSEQLKIPSTAEPVDPTRVRAFAIFFKRYMSVSTIVVAALPIPVTSIGLIPTFQAQTKLLSVYASLFCFLTLGLIFYLRHQFARIMFYEYLGFRGSSYLKFFRAALIGFFPFFFIAASVVAVFQYNDVLILNANMVTDKIKNGTVKLSIPGEEKDLNPESMHNILKYTQLNNIPFSSRLMVLYLSIFIMAEAAFILMALKEYLQDLIKVSELELMHGAKSADRRVSSSAPSITANKSLLDA